MRPKMLEGSLISYTYTASLTIEGATIPLFDSLTAVIPGAFLKARLGLRLRLCVLKSVQYALQQNAGYNASCIHSTRSLSQSQSPSRALRKAPDLVIAD